MVLIIECDIVLIIINFYILLILLWQVNYNIFDAPPRVSSTFVFYNIVTNCGNSFYCLIFTYHYLTCSGHTIHYLKWLTLCAYSREKHSSEHQKSLTMSMRMMYFKIGWKISKHIRYVVDNLENSQINDDFDMNRNNDVRWWFIQDIFICLKNNFAVFESVANLLDCLSYKFIDIHMCVYARVIICISIQREQTIVVSWM